MRVWLRLLIVWFIALALPAQGMAGATLAHCGSSHERMASALQAGQSRHADHAAAAAHHHDAGSASAPHDDTADLGQFKCSSCASCCAASALPSAPPRLPESAAASAVFAEPAVSVDAYATDGPDRPPRIRLV